MNRVVLNKDFAARQRDSYRRVKRIAAANHAAARARVLGGQV
jgi:hypothetical protein